MAGKGIKHPHLRRWGPEWVCRGFLHGTWTGHLPPSCFSTVAMPLLINTALVCGCSDGWSNLSNGSIPTAKGNPNKQVLVSRLTHLTSAELSKIQTFTMWLFLIKLYKWNVSNCYHIRHTVNLQVKNFMIKPTLNHSMNSVVNVNRVYKSSGYQLMSTHAKVIQWQLSLTFGISMKRSAVLLGCTQVLRGVLPPRKTLVGARNWKHPLVVSGSWTTGSWTSFIHFCMWICWDKHNS